MTTTDKAATALALVILCFCAAVQVMGGNGGDKDWLLLTARMWLEGKRLYQDLVLVQPPLFLWIYGGIEALAKLVPMEDYHLLALLGLAASLLSARLCVKLLAHAAPFAGEPRRQRQLMLLLLFVFVVWSNPIYFFDREHMFMLLVFPFLLRFSPALDYTALPLRLRIAATLPAAIGFCIKPHCALVFVAVQLMLALRMRSLRALFCLENAIVCGGGVFYLLLVWLLTPEYYTLVLPMALVTYSASADTQGWMFYGAVSLLIFAVTMADLRPRDASPFRATIRYFLGLAMAMLAYALANNGWGYAWNPLNSVLMLLCGWVLWEHLWLRAQKDGQEKERRRHRQGMRACQLNLAVNTFIVLLLCTLYLQPGQCDEACQVENDMAALVKQQNAGNFGAISHEFTRWSHLARSSGADWDTRFNNLWMVAKFFISDAEFTTKHNDVLAYVAGALAEDLNRHAPRLVFVDDTDYIYRIYHPHDLIALFSAWPAFAEAWKPYRHLQSFNVCRKDKSGAIRKANCRYNVYLREAAP